MNTAFGLSDSSFRAKGTVTGEHFNGGRIWTAIQDDKATIITQWTLGRAIIHSNILPIDCEPNYSICFEATVTDTTNSSAAKSGDKFIVKIDPQNKKQVIVGKSGFLENVEVVLSVDKIFTKSETKSEIHNTNSKENPPEFNYVASLRNMFGDGLFEIPITEAYASNTVISNDERAQSFIVRFSGGLVQKPIAISSFIKFQLTSSTTDIRGSLPTYKISSKSDKPSFYLESFPTPDKKEFYRGVDRWMTRSTAVSPFDVSVDYVSGKGSTIYKWDFSDCELTGFGTYLQDIKNIYSFSNKEQAEIRERATFECGGIKLNVPK